MDHYDRHNILSDNQHGFRSKRSCETQSSVTIDSIACTLADGGQVDIILLDFLKAFDTVAHQRLLRKLQYEPYNRSRTSSTTDCNKSSSMAKLHQQLLSGVPQGTVLGTLLFLTFINDLPEVTNSEAHLFANYCLLYRPIFSRKDTEYLQQDLAALED
jgi:hypothetical protein